MEEQKKGRFRETASIRLQFSLIFIILIFCTIGIFCLINHLFLGNYYLTIKQREIVGAYQEIGNMFSGKDELDEDDKLRFMQICSSGNFSAAVLDSSLNTIISTTGDRSLLVFRLFDHIFDFDEEAGASGEDAPGAEDKDRGQDKERREETKVLLEENGFEVRLSYDPRMGMDYLELWGMLPNGNAAILRTPLSGIRESARVSNRLMGAAGLIMALVCAVVIWFITGRITRPIKELAGISERLAALDFDAKYSGGGPNEVAALGNHMNVLSDTLQKTISELKTANNELKRDIEQKEKINSMRLEFLSNVAHELKTPIALIQGYAEGLKDNVNEDEESREFYCDVIIDEAAKMNLMVKNLMALNQLEFGQYEISMSRFDITAMIRGIMQSSDILLKTNGIRAEFNEAGSFYVWSDAFRTEEVFNNYFSNAVRYCSEPEGGGGKRIEVKLIRRGKVLRVSVFNTGKPIPEESLPMLWDKFYKVDKARTHEVGGSGIGLSIVKAVMEALNQDYGVINYENGVEFYFELDCSMEKDSGEAV